MVWLPFDITGSGSGLLHPLVNHALLQNDLFLVALQIEVVSVSSRRKNPSTPIAPHTITSDACPYAPESRLNTKFANYFLLPKTFVTTSALFSAEVVPIFESFAPHCTPLPNSPHLFHTTLLQNINNLKHLVKRTAPNTSFYCNKLSFLSVPVVARSKAQVCGRSSAEIVGSNPTGSMDVCLLWVLCVVR